MNSASSIMFPFSGAAIAGARERLSDFTVKLLQLSDLTVDCSSIILHDEIGRGPAGAVYRSDIGGDCFAVKVQIITSSVDKQENLLVELSVLRSLPHPQMVKFLGASCDTKQLYSPKVNQALSKLMIVTEFCGNGNLRDALHSNRDGGRDVSWGRRVRLALDVALGLEFLHSQNILHRDLKTTNILVDNNWCAKLSGLSHACHEDFRINRDISSIDEFISPETALSCDFDQSSDIYSFGIILCEIMTLQDPSVLCKKINSTALKVPSLLRRKYEKYDAKNVEIFLLHEESLSGALTDDCPEELEALAYLCCDEDQRKRPTIHICIEELLALALKAADSNVLSRGSDGPAISSTALSSLNQYAQRHRVYFPSLDILHEKDKNESHNNTVKYDNKVYQNADGNQDDNDKQNNREKRYYKTEREDIYNVSHRSPADHNGHGHINDIQGVTTSSHSESGHDKYSQGMGQGRGLIGYSDSYDHNRVDQGAADPYMEARFQHVYSQIEQLKQENSRLNVHLQALSVHFENILKNFFLSRDEIHQEVRYAQESSSGSGDNFDTNNDTYTASKTNHSNNNGNSTNNMKNMSSEDYLHICTHKNQIGDDYIRILQNNDNNRNDDYAENNDNDNGNNGYNGNRRRVSRKLNLTVEETEENEEMIRNKFSESDVMSNKAITAKLKDIQHQLDMVKLYCDNNSESERHSPGQYALQNEINSKELNTSNSSSINPSISFSSIYPSNGSSKESSKESPSHEYISKSLSSRMEEPSSYNYFPSKESTPSLPIPTSRESYNYLPSKDASSSIYPSSVYSSSSVYSTGSLRYYSIRPAELYEEYGESVDKGGNDEKTGDRVRGKDTENRENKGKLNIVENRGNRGSREYSDMTETFKGVKEDNRVEMTPRPHKITESTGFEESVVRGRSEGSVKSTVRASADNNVMSVVRGIGVGDLMSVVRGQKKIVYQENPMSGTRRSFWREKDEKEKEEETVNHLSSALGKYLHTVTKLENSINNGSHSVDKIDKIDKNDKNYEYSNHRSRSADKKDNLSVTYDNYRSIHNSIDKNKILSSTYKSYRKYGEDNFSPDNTLSHGNSLKNRNSFYISKKDNEDTKNQAQFRKNLRRKLQKVSGGRAPVEVMSPTVEVSTLSRSTLETSQHDSDSNHEEGSLRTAPSTDSLVGLDINYIVTEL